MITGLHIKALRWVWGIYTACGILAVIIAIVFPPDAILRNSPTCYSIKQFGRECFMCGSTRSFIQAGHGNFATALEFNRLAVVLFVLAIINFIVFIYYSITTKLLTKKKRLL